MYVVTINTDYKIVFIAKINSGLPNFSREHRFKKLFLK